MAKGTSGRSGSPFRSAAEEARYRAKVLKQMARETERRVRASRVRRDG